MTDWNGNYTIGGLATGTYKVRFSSMMSGYLSEWYNDRADMATANTVSVASGQTTALNDAVLSWGGVITGVVKNSNGVGIGNAQVIVFDINNMWLQSASTGISGAYTINGLQAGAYKVCFDGSSNNYMNECYDDLPWNSWIDIASATFVSVTMGQTTILNETVLARGGMIAGSVKNAGGSGIGNVSVSVYDSTGIWLRGTMTDWSGSYRIGGLQSGNYKVCFDAMMSGGYANECYDNRAWMDLTNATPVPVVSGQTTTLNDAVLTQAGYQFIGFLQPIMNDGSAIFKSGRTVPIKFQLTDGNGAFVMNASATLGVYKVTNDILGSMNVDSSGNADSDTSFRYDPASNQYIYNLSSKGLGTGTFVLRVELDDGSAHEVRISLR